MLMMSLHIDVLSSLSEYKLPPAMTAKYAPDQLITLCDELKRHSIEASLLPINPYTQQKLIEQPGFFELFQTLQSINVKESSIESWLAAERITGIGLMEYPIPLLKLAFDTDLPSIEAKQIYLQRYLAQDRSPETLAAVAENLRFICNNGCANVLSLTDKEHLLLEHPFLCRYIEDAAVIDSLSILLANTSLVEYLDALYELDVDKVFIKYELRLLGALSEECFSKLRTVQTSLRNSPVRTERFLSLWLENGAHEGDLPQLVRKLVVMTDDQQREALDTRLSYLSLLYGGSLGEVDLRAVPGYMLPVLACALANRQRTFLKLVSDHYDVFCDLPYNSLLFCADFFSRITLNTVTLKNVTTCCEKTEHVQSLTYLKQQPYTFAELRLLADQPAVYAKLYSRLSISRTDDRLTVLRQLTKREALSESMNDGQLDSLALRLSEKPLMTWMAQEFAHISGIKPHLCVLCLAEYERLARFIPDMLSAAEVSFAVRQVDVLDSYADWDDVRDHIVSIDADWQRLRDELALDDAFVSEHRDSIFRFLTEDGANAALAYSECLSDATGFYRIVTAELMGQYHAVKYHADDLDREIRYNVSDIQKQLWMENTHRTDDALLVEERDDFFTTLRIGEIPERTCLNYRNGMYRDCLLSCYDSNKKFMIASFNGRPVGRAMLRLTKGRAGKNKDGTSLEFADLRGGTTGLHENVEELVLFLERPYITCVGNQIKKQIMLEFMKLALAKAQEMNARPVFSQDYASLAPDLRFVSMPYYLRISNSKGGCQYLDSLGGSSSTSSEGSYRSNLFLLQAEQ